MGCSVKKEIQFGLEVVTLENEFVRAVVLAGKGADLLEFVWKPLEIDCLLKTDVTLVGFKGMDLHKKRLGSHRDHSLGGWMDVLPHLGEYKDVVISESNGGVATTLPWDCEIIQGNDSASVRCTVELPLLPLTVDKTFTIRRGGAALEIGERLTMGGDAPARFTWVQHAMFSGNFVNESTIVHLPTDKVFNAWEHMRNPGGGEPCDFVYPVDAVYFSRRGRPFDLRRPLPQSYDGWEFVVFPELREGRVSLSNPEANLAVELTWDLKRFPYLRSLYHSGRHGVTVGLEPGDDFFAGFDHSLKYGTYTTMKPGEVSDTWVKLEYRENGKTANSL
jgi:hypothetical protein